MFEKIIEQKIAKISEKIKFVNFILLQDLINNSDLEEPYKVFIKSSVECWIYEDELLRKANKSFNFNSSEDINKQINKIYFENFKLTRTEFDKLLDYSIKIRLNYLLRPYFTLNQFVFKEDATKNILDVKRKLKFFVDYSYLLLGLDKILDDKQKTKEIISKIEFNKKLETIDKDKLLDFSDNEYEILFKPMFEFFNFDSYEYKKIKIPVEALIIFLQDKGLYRLASRLKTDAENKIKNEYDIQEFFLVVAENGNDKIESNDFVGQFENKNQEVEIVNTEEINAMTTDSKDELMDIRKKLNALFE